MKRRTFIPEKIIDSFEENGWVVQLRIVQREGGQPIVFEVGTWRDLFHRMRTVRLVQPEDARRAFVEARHRVIVDIAKTALGLPTQDIAA